MRIGIDARFYSSKATGIGRYVFELVRHLLKLDMQNTYVIFLNSPEFEKFHAPQKNVEKILADAPHYSLAEQWHFWRVLSSAKLDLMHFTHFNAPILYRGPGVVTIHDLTLSLYPGKKMNGWLHRLAYNVTLRSVVGHAKRIIAVSQNTKKDLVRLLKTPQQKIQVIGEGVAQEFRVIPDQKLVSNFLNQRGIASPYLLYTGVWRSHKNLVRLVQAFALLRTQYQFHGSLVIGGKEDPYYPEIKQAVRDHHLQKFVTFTGFVSEEELVLLYNGATAYVFPSLYEGFGLPALEAFACGTPVCASQTSSLPEVCGEENAVFFDPLSPEDMAKKIAGLLDDPKQQEELIKRGLDRAKDFSWEEMARETLEVYNKAIL